MGAPEQFVIASREEIAMSHTWSNTNKHDPYQKVHFKEYLSNINEPVDDSMQYTPEDLVTEMLEDGRNVRQDIRRRARRLRRTAG